MPKFEYDIKTIGIKDDYLTKLNEWGDEGWELVNEVISPVDVITYPPPDAIDTRPIRETKFRKICTLKRQKI
jgi:hypothetical protein